jgi:uncharacterized protein GlcG (DUF336 family)
LDAVKITEDGPQTLTAEAAWTLCKATLDEASDLGLNMVVAVCDSGGNLLALLRSPRAFLVSIGVAQDKAYTCAQFACMPTDKVNEMITRSGETVRLGVMMRPRMVTFGGGVPVIVAGVAVAAMGVSGGSEADDLQCVRAGLAAIGADTSVGAATD